MSFFKKFNNLDTKRNFVSLAKNRFLKLGRNIDGEAADDNFGFSVSMNANGDIVAIGAPTNDGPLAFGQPNCGSVRVYQWNGNAWTKLGQDIDGEFGLERSGYSVSMNAAGNRVVIGSPYHVSNSGQVRVYEWSGTVWTQLGQDINGSGFFGCSVSMNNDGNRIAIGAYLYDSNVTQAGLVKIYEFNGITWTQLGANIQGAGAGWQLGYSVSMNAAGNRVAVGSIGVDRVQIYNWDGTTTWTQLGNDINGEVTGDDFGYLVSMNANGDRVAIATLYNNGGFNSGRVQIYSLNGAVWTQLGVNIDGEAADDALGSSLLLRTVSMNAVGDKVAIGAIYNDVDGAKVNAGHVRVYSWGGTTWTQLGADIDGEVTGDFSGKVSMNAVGDRVAIGAPSNQSKGHVRVYKDYTNYDNWIQLGSNIVKEFVQGLSSRRFGYSSSINKIGNIVAIGDPKAYEGGTVKIFQAIASTGKWIQLGENITRTGSTDSEQFGTSVSLNAAGNIIVIGAGADIDGQFSRAGIVEAFSWNGSTWTQLGQTLVGSTGTAALGRAVSLNAIGNRFAVINNLQVIKVFEWNGSSWIQLGTDISFGNGISCVAINANGNRVVAGGASGSSPATDFGKVRIYDWNGSTWTQLGSDLNDNISTQSFGGAISINDLGNVIVVGVPSYNSPDYFTTGLTGIGAVRVFNWNGSTWTKLGSDILGTEHNQYLGSSVSINSLGDRIVAGGPYYDIISPAKTGKARIFSWNGLTWNQVGADLDGLYLNSTFGRSVSMNGAGDKVIVGAPTNYQEGARVFSLYKDLSTLYGTTWQPKDINRYWASIAVSGRDPIWGGRQIAAVQGGQIYISADVGNTWTATESNRNWSAVALNTSGGMQAAVVYGGRIYVSIDAGNTWNPKAGIGNWMDIAISLSGAKLTAVASSGGSESAGLYISSDYGDTWQLKLGVASFSAVAMSSSGTVRTTVIDGGRIYVSTDDGNTWNPKESNRNWEDVAMSSDGKVQTAIFRGANGVFISKDFGDTWTFKSILGVGIFQDFLSIAMSSDGTIQTTVVQSGKIYVSTDSGSTWTQRESDRNWWGIAMTADGTTQMAIANGGQIYVSTY